MLRERGRVPGNGNRGLGRRKRTFPLLSSSQAALSPKGKTRTWPPSSTRAAPDGQLSGRHADAGRPPTGAAPSRGRGTPLPASLSPPIALSCSQKWFFTTFCFQRFHFDFFGCPHAFGLDGPTTVDREKKCSFCVCVCEIDAI